MDVKRIRKAVVAGGCSAVAVLATQVAKDGLPATGDGWVGLIVALFGAAVVGGFATYQTRNQGYGLVNGSEPTAPPTAPPR